MKRTLVWMALAMTALWQTATAQNPPFPPETSAADSPQTAMETMTARLRRSTETLLPSHEPLGAKAETLAEWLGRELPAESCNLGTWSTAAAVGQMPIFWNAKRHFYEVDRKNWQAASPALQRYTYYYLRAYAGLEESQRAAHSLLAVGLAAVTAAEVVYPENWAVLPDNVAGPAEVVATFEAASPGFIAKARVAGKGATTDLVKSAIQSLTSVGGAFQTGAAHEHPEKLTEIPWEESGAEGIFLDKLLPSHPESQKRLQEQAYKIQNLTLRMGLVAALAKARLSFIAEDSRAENPWKTVAEKETAALREELKARGMGAVAPVGGADPKSLLKTDPGVLRPLAVVMIAPLGPQLLQAYQAKGTEGCREVLAGSKEFGQLCDIAGQRPELVLAAKPKVLGESVFLGKMNFRNMLRVPAAPGEATGAEEVSVDLVAIVPRGDGQPIMGFDANAFVCAKLPNETTPRWIPAHDIVAGSKVLGHRPLGDPATGTTCDLRQGVQEEFFTVTEVRMVDNVKGTNLIEVDKRKLAVAIPQSILMNAAGTGVWVQSRLLDPKCYSWAGPEKEPLSLEEREKTRFGTIAETTEPQRLVQLFLTHEQDELAPFANNCVVSLDPAGAASKLTTECSSGDISLVDESEEVQTSDGKTPLCSVKKNEKCDPKADATVVKPFWQRPADCPWTYPSFTPGEAWATRKVDTRLITAIKLCVSDTKGGAVRDFICSKNTKLLAIDEKGQTKFRRARNAKPGERLVKSFAQDGETLVSVDVVSVDEIELPAQNFVGMELSNLKFAQTGPLMVEWQASPWHLFAYGVAPQTRLATCVKEGEAYRLQGSIVVPKPGENPTIAAFEPAYSFITTTSWSNGEEPSLITRMLEVTCGKDRIVVAPSQAFVTGGRTQGRDVDVVLAFQLNKGDRIFVGHDGDLSASPVAVDNVTPVFRVRSPVQKLRTQSGSSWHGKTPLRTDVCIGESMCMAMAVPMTVPVNIEPYKLAAPGNAQAGPACGTAEGKNGGNSARVDQNGGGGIPIPPPPPVDCLDLPKDAVEQFAHRAGLIRTLFEGEKDQIQSVERQGVLARFDAALSPGSWPFGVSKTELAETLANWLKANLEVRASYLKRPTYSETPSIYLADLTLAAWLKAAGCQQTADSVGRNAVELAILAGCSPKAVHAPDLASRMDLGLLIAAENWITQTQREQTHGYAVSPSTSRQVTTWAENIKVSNTLLDTSIPVAPPVPREGQIQLEELFTIWNILGKRDSIDWPDFSNADSPNSRALSEWLKAHRPGSEAPAPATSGTERKGNSRQK